MRFSSPFVLVFVATGCGAATRPITPIGVTLENQRAEAPAPKPAPKPEVPADVVARAAQSFHAQRNADATTLSEPQFFDELSHFDVVCLGEAHDEARDHFAELAVVEGLERRARVSGRALGVGFEMFQAPYGPVLRAYQRGRLDDAGLRKKSHYDERWGYPYAYYRPVLAYGKSLGLPLRALNAPRELTHAVAEKGLSGLTPKQRAQLPELDLNDAAHRAAFDHLMAHHPSAPGVDPNNFYAVQVVWDEVMADNAVSWLSARAPSRQLVILAGSAHCRREAIPARIERRAAARVANVRLSAKGSEDSDGFGYTLVFDEHAATTSRDDG